MATITILYPSGHEFDLRYYLETHMPLVERSWKPHGLLGWTITRLAPGQAHQVQALVRFDSLAAWEAASRGAHAEAVFGDIAAFTAAEPLVLRGEVVASAWAWASASECKSECEPSGSVG
ncbi:hypothetical protein E4U41_003287 [Claviceps citrina]|nr:hypothetical protein E4U41_003287 [Claviceps citrina]